MKTSDMSGKLTDPCPVCTLRPAKSFSPQGISPEAHEGDYTVCFGCGLVQVVRNGQLGKLEEFEAEMVFRNPDVIRTVLAMSQLRAMNPLRTAELVREQNSH